MGLDKSQRSSIACGPRASWYVATPCCHVTTTGAEQSAQVGGTRPLVIGLMKMVLLAGAIAHPFLPQLIVPQGQWVGWKEERPVAWLSVSHAIAVVGPASVPGFFRGCTAHMLCSIASLA